MKFILNISLILLASLSYGQAEDCYNLFRNQGIELFDTEKFVEARDRFDAAEACRNKPQNNDLAEWRKKATLANEAALIKARNEAENAKLLAQENEKKAIRLARLTEGNRLALLANIKSDEKKYDEALFLSFEAYKLLGEEASPQIRQAFSQAVYYQMTQKITISEEEDITYFQQLPDTKNIWFSLEDNSVKSLNLESQKLVNFTNQTPAIQFANNGSDGRQLLIGSTDGTATLKSIVGGSDYSLTGHTEAVLSGMISPQAQKLVTASRDNTAKLWDLRGKLIETLSGHSGNIYEAKFSPDGTHLLTRSADGIVKVWDQNGRLSGTLDDKQIYVYTASFSPDGKKVLTASANNKAQLWDLKGNSLAHFEQHKAAVKEAVFSKTGDRILTRSLDNTVKLWNLNGQLLADLKGTASNAISCAVFGPEDASIITGAKDQNITIWDLQGNVIKQISAHEGGVENIKVSTDGQYLLSTSSKGVSKLWNGKGEQLMAINLAVNSRFSLDRKHIFNILEKKVIAITPLPEEAFKILSENSPISRERSEELRRIYGIQRFEN